MNDTDNTLPMASPPISSSHGIQPQDTLLQRGAFDAPTTPGTLGRLDRFEILKLLGEGGMGQVYLAREPLTSAQVAIKIMKPQTADDPLEVHRFLTEARHMYQLSNPRILPVLEVSDRPAGPYYVMPYIGGGSLLGQYKPGQPMPTEKILTIARQIAEALAHAHGHGLIHRDIKPGNVLLDKGGNAYLTDFGLVRTVFNDSMVDASASHLEGTAPYMSPAVARGNAEDTRCDIYAFGALLYELITGQPPYTGRTPQMILDQILKGPPKPIREVTPKASPALVKITEACMARELRDRYASMDDVVADLVRVAKGQAPFGPHRQPRPLPRIAAVLIGTLAVIGMAGVAIHHFSSAAQPGATVKGIEPTALQPTAHSPQSPIPYTYTTNNGAITITKYTGPGGDVKIPSTINGLPVVGVGNKAFYDCTGLTKVTIPDSVNSIGDEAFSRCSKMNSFAIPKGVASMGYQAFFACTSLTNVTIAAGVTRIGANSFHYCTNLTNITLPNSVTDIGHYAFTQCNGLTSITIPKNVTSIGANPFADCGKLVSIMVDGANPVYSSSEDGVIFNKDKTTLICYPSGRFGNYTIPNGVTDIGGWAFQLSSTLTTVTVPESVTDIGEYAFWGCRNLTGVYFKGNAPSFGQEVFDVADKAIIYYRPGTKEWGKEFGGRPTAVWEEAGTGDPTAYSLQPASPAETDVYQFACTATNGAVTIVKYMGDGGAVVIPSKVSGLPVTTIKNEAFLNCTSVTSITIPNSITAIGNGAFKNCAGITNMIIGSSVATIGDEAFLGCSKLTTVMIPTSVTSIGVSSFFDCKSLASILVDFLNPSYGSSVDGVLFNKDKTTLLCYPVGRAGSYAIPKSVTSIGTWAFRDAINLTSVTIPNSVVMIDGCAFWGCSNLTSLEIPASVSTIKGSAVAHCSRLKAIRVDRRNPAYTSDADGVVFSRDKTKLICYPAGKPGGYVIPDSVTHIEDCAFEGCVFLTDVTIPNSVTSIGYSAFVSCYSLTNIAIPPSITQVEFRVFGNCTNLVSVTIPNSITGIGPSAFIDCTKLACISIPRSVTSIGSWAFWGCSSLTNVCFNGNAPSGASEMSVFWGANNATVLYRPGTKGWGKEFGGRPTAVWEESGKAEPTASSLQPTASESTANRLPSSSLQPTASLPETDIYSFACVSENGGVAIVKYTGDGGAVVIPAKVSGRPVTTLKDTAFQNSASVTSVLCPSSVTNIGFNAFRNCPQLKRIDLGGITSIPNDMFNGYTNLTSVTIPDSVGSIGERAFKDCTALSSLVIGTGVTNILNEAFLGCSSLPSVTIPDSVTNIGNDAFKNCTGLDKITILNGVTRIGNSAFYGCTRLTKVTLPASVTSMDMGWGFPFSGCNNLAAIAVDILNPAYSSDADGVLFNKERTTLLRYPLGKGGHYTTPNSVTALGDLSFYGCTNLTDIAIRDGVASIGQHAFTECMSLSVIKIPASVNSICGNIGVRCSKLERFVVDDANQTYRTDSDGVIFSKDEKSLVSYPRGKRGDYAIPSGVTYIGFTSFEGCPWLTNVTIPDSVNNIEQWSFVGNHSLNSVTIPAGIAEIKHCTFYDCRNLASVYFMGDAPKLNPEWWWSFGGTPTIYHRPGTKGWGKELAGKPTAVWVPEAQGMATNLVSTAFSVSGAEKRQEWDSALLEYENAYDSKVNDEFMRSTLRKKFGELRAKVQPNRDPAKAGVWKVKAYAFRELDWQWTDPEKMPRHSQWKLKDSEIATIRTSLGAFADRVWEYTSGSLRIEWTLDVIDKPLARLDDDGKIWPGPWACMPYLTELKTGEADTVMVYAKVRGGKNEVGVAVPTTVPAGTKGVMNETKGAIYIGFNVDGSAGSVAAPGENELREWLQNVQWTLEEYQAYPYGLIASSYGGRTEGELGGDYCYRRKPGEEGWLGYYRHLMQEHVTRKMWRELSVRSVPDNVWMDDFSVNQYARRAAVLGPFPAAGKPDGGIEEVFIDEVGIVPKIGEKIDSLEWKAICSRNGKVLNMGENESGAARVCYLAFCFQSDRDQKALVKIGSDNHSKLWQNGSFILSVTNSYGIAIDQSTAETQLKQGENRFLLKVADWGGAWEASFRLCSPDGNSLEGVRYVDK